MNPLQPHTYPRRILLMVTGRTPQVVTETLYALCNIQQPTFVPTEIRLITTSEGAKDAILSLLSKDPGWFHQLRHDYNLPAIEFTPDHIETLKNPQGQSLSDIRSHSENDLAADQIIARVRHLTADTRSALHVSLAGGRKTMGYYLGYALSLFGRPQDRLSHVLVSSPYESNRDFYYPTPQSKIIYTFASPPQQQRPIDAKDASVTLADIPFVRLRDQLPQPLKTLQQTNSQFTDIITAAQQALEPARVTIDYPQGCLHTHTEAQVKLPAVQLAFYGWVARNAPKQTLRRPNDGSPEAALGQTYLQENNLAGGRPQTRQSINKEGGMSSDFFDTTISKTNKAIVQALGALAPSYLIQTHPNGAHLTLSPEHVTFIEE